MVPGERLELHDVGQEFGTHVDVVQLWLEVGGQFLTQRGREVGMGRDAERGGQIARQGLAELGPFSIGEAKGVPVVLHEQIVLAFRGRPISSLAFALFDIPAGFIRLSLLVVAAALPLPAPLVDLDRVPALSHCPVCFRDLDLDRPTIKSTNGQNKTKLKRKEEKSRKCVKLLS